MRKWQWGFGLSVAFLSFFIGLRLGQLRSGATPDEVQELRKTVRLYSQQYAQMVHQWMTVRQDRDLVLAATARLQQQNKDLLDSMGALEQQITLYQRILNPKQTQMGLSIEQFVLHTTPEPYHFAYRILVTWAQPEVRLRSGRITVLIEGMQQGHLVRLSMHVGDDNFRLHYFQSLVGDWVLPAHFQPQTVFIRLESSRLESSDVHTGARTQKVEKQFRWEVSPA